VLGGASVAAAAAGASVAAGAADVAGAHAPRAMLLKTNRETNCIVILFMFSSASLWRNIILLRIRILT
jgi:hypothetical protein